MNFYLEVTVRVEHQFIKNDPALISFIKRRVGSINKLRLIDIPDFLEEAYILEKHHELALHLKSIFPSSEEIICQALADLE